MVKAVKVFSGVSRWRLAMLFLAAFHTCSVGPKVGGVGWQVDGCYAFQGLAGGVEVGQGPGVVEPGVVQDDGDLLFFLGLSLEAAPS